MKKICDVNIENLICLNSCKQTVNIDISYLTHVQIINIFCFIKFNICTCFCLKNIEFNTCFL